MHQRILTTLYRQKQAMKLLVHLLEEEYEYLRKRQTDEVVALEMSIHELIRQMAQEKTDMKAMLDGGKVLVYAGLLPKEDGDYVRELFAEIDKNEQKAARIASRNAQLSLAFLDQSQRLMQELHSQIIPNTSITYGRRGNMGSHRPQAALISGRL